MPSKYQQIMLLAEETAREITSDTGRYMDFLTTAAHNFKYGFREQLLIFAQKPDATACGEIDFWNSHGRWVNRGIKGIALLVDGNAPYKLRYVFDMSDTNSRTGQTVPVWQMAPRYEAAVMESLENRFGLVESADDFPSCLIATTALLAEDNAADYLSELSGVKENSLLSDLDALNTEVWLKETMKCSVAFMLLTRCGYDARQYFSSEDFARVCDFNTPETISILGASVSDIAEMALREIAATVFSLRKAERQNRTFAESGSIRYDKDKETKISDDERSEQYGADLQERGRLSSPQPHRAGGPEGREIWDAAAQLPPPAPEWALYRDADERQAEPPLGGDRPAGQRDDGAADRADGPGAGGDRGSQGQGSDEMGGPDEQHPGLGGGDRDAGAGLPVNSPLPAEEEPPQHPIDWSAVGPTGLQFSYHDFNARSEIPYYHEDTEKNELLRISDELKNSRVEIAAFFAEHEDSKERSDFIKSFFDNTYVEKILSNGQRAGYRAWDDVLTLWRGSYTSREKEAFLRWPSVANSIYGMILLDKWLDPDERPLSGEAEQISLIEKAEAEKASAFSLPQEAIDYILCSGSGSSGGKYRIYEQYQKNEGKQSNISFLRNEYGIGGRSDAIPGSGYWEDHDGKGIRISRNYGEPDGKLLLTWTKVEKRIGELIAADRYLSPSEKEKYPAYLRSKAAHEARWEIAKEFRSIVYDYNDFQTQSGKKEKRLELYALSECWGAFGGGEKKMFARKKEGEFILPLMRKAMGTIIGENTHLTERCEAMLSLLRGDIAKPLEPTYDELNPPPEPPKEYLISLGDTVYLGTQEYEVLSLGDETVRLFDPSFPLLNKELPRTDFDRMLAENPLNDHLLQVVVEATPPDAALEQAKQLINEYCMEVFEEEADFSDLSHVDLAFSSTGNHQYPIEVIADLVDCRLVYKVAGEDVATLQCHDLEDMQQYLGNLEFDALIAYAEEQFEKKQKEKPPLTVEERFFVVDVDRGYQKSYAIWDEVSGDFYVDKDGVSDEFSSRWQAEDYLEQVKKQEQEKTSEEREPALSTQDFLGKEVSAEGRRFVVDSLDETNRTVSLRDVTFEGGIGFPIFRVEPVNTVQGWLEQAEKKNEPTSPSLEETAPIQSDRVSEMLQQAALANELYQQTGQMVFGFEAGQAEPVVPSRETPAEEKPLAPPSAPKPRTKVSPFIIRPEIPDSQRQNFCITDDHLGEGGAKAKFQGNLAAIQTLQQIEQEGRLATPAEQEVLSRYVGWGGLPMAFDESNASWADEYRKLKAILPTDEYESARASTLNAHYTSPVVIKAIYQGLERLGFKTGNILEPSCGIGNFLGLLPESMSASKLYGVELDSITGRIAQQLYQRSSIAVQGFEKTDLPDSFFDAAVGNVPFGSYKVADKRYDRLGFTIHNYFLAKTLDKLRPGGVMAFVTSRYTMDAKSPEVRKYLAERAELIGAIRLPNNAFLANAGTEVVSDILFFQKKEAPSIEEPEWVHLEKTKDGFAVNSYFVTHPEMVLGTFAAESTQYGREECTVRPIEGANLAEQLADAIQNINGSIREYEVEDPEGVEVKSIPADPSVRNFSYTLVDGQIYYRENSWMNPVELPVTAQGRVKGLIAIRDCVRTLIEYQTENFSEEEIKAEQQKLNTLYDAFEKKYGRINSRANRSAFEADSSYFLLSSLEVLDSEGNFLRKADMFTKRTIRQKTVVTSVDTPSEALALSLAEKAKIDLPYMAQLTGKTEDEITTALAGVIFIDPLKKEWQTADEYLSGNIREKLAAARLAAESDERYAVNAEALEKVLPKDLTASEISVRLGATWLPPEVIQEFIFQLFDTPRYQQWSIKVHYSEHTGGWNIEGKSRDKANFKATKTYGTERINGYKIIEDTLNLRDVRIFDYIEQDGKRTPVLNKRETAIAQGKQELIKQAFRDWIWADPQRREQLCRLYNDRFNAIRPREYNGSHLTFPGMTPEITLRTHQVNAIAHILYGGNTLLAHVVGAGKTFEMVAAAQESKRLGLCQKSMFVVPNHLIEQWAAEYLQLYPSANILVATKKDFETRNRKRFCGRIATGDYDAIIIGHSQFEKIPMSIERQIYTLEREKEEILAGIQELKDARGDKFSVKQLERSRKSIQAKLDKLNDQSRKDDVVTFEELGIDRLFVDEAHYYKNLAAFTKMRNVGGISQTEAQKSSDLYMKCRYLDELTGGRGTIFATGTPISNSMVELYTMQKYLQYGLLEEKGLLHFDAWASTFGETITAIELAPEGTGYRSKTRFSKFYNLPELMMMFKEVADIQTADMLQLPVPKANPHNIVLKPSEQQKEMVASLGERAERVRNKMVNPNEDNMLVITNDGRKLALDQRLLNPLLPDSETGKIASCAENVAEIWQKTADQRSAQMVFCDLSTPRGDGTFNAYDDLREKLIARGIPAEEIAFIHSAKNEAQKKEMFGKVRSGEIRVLIGSTQKMGAGTNVQQKLVALHHLDCPWRPSDLQQREGRIVRQGNENSEVEIFTYVTENTFDSYLYQLVEGKQKFIGQIMTSKSPVRSADDIDETALSYAEIKALCAGNPHIKEKMDLDVQVQRLQLLKSSHLSQRYALEDTIYKVLPQKIAGYEQRIAGYQADMTLRQESTCPNADGFSPMEIEGVTYTDKKSAGSAILAACKAMSSPEAVHLGRYRGFEMELFFETFSKEYRVTMKGALCHTTALGTDILGNIVRLDNALHGMETMLAFEKEQLESTKAQLASAKEEVEKPFPQEDELKEKTARLAELNALLELDKHEAELVDGEPEEGAEAPERDSRDRER